MRKLVIGDIHGGYKAVVQAMERAGVQEDDLLIFLGDYVDGWSGVVETVDLMLELEKTHRCIFIKGNHDELCAHWLRTGQDNPIWLAQGGRSSVSAYKEVGAEKKERHLEFYKSLQPFYLDDENRLFLHAGFTNIKGVAYEYFAEMLYWDRTLWELALAIAPDMEKSDPFFPNRLAIYNEIYIGHTPTTRIGITVPHRAVNVWNIDTGAAFKGPVSIMDIDTKEYWQSDPVYTLYPDEQGRNSVK